MLSWTAIAAAVWLLGVFGLAGNWLWKWIACGRLIRRCGVPADDEMELLVVRTAERLGMRRAVPVRIVPEPIGPAVFGLWRPVVVIPAGDRSRHTPCAVRIVEGVLTTTVERTAHGVCLLLGTDTCP